MKDTALNKTNKKVIAREQEKSGLDTVSKASLTLMGSVSAIIGIWAVACIVSVLTKVGPLEFVKSWFQAVTGM